MLTNNVPMGWGIFSVLTPVNVNSPICLGGGEKRWGLCLTSALHVGVVFVIRVTD